MSETLRPVEFFECDCFGTDHLIRAEYSITEYDWNGNMHKERELIIAFEARLADYDSFGIKDNFVERWYSKFVWRLKNAFKILFSGEIKTSGYFVPSRSYLDSKTNIIENTFGYKTTKNFAKWLDFYAEKIKNDYEEDIKKYNEMKASTINGKKDN